MKLHAAQGDRGPVFWAESSFAEKDIVKQAGFWWHGGGDWCLQGKCGACKAGLGKVWWTPKRETAVRLLAHADDAAKAILGEVQATIEASHATDTSIDIPAPEGLSYFPFQKAGIAFAAARPSTLIADEMGLGKTIQGIGLINCDPSVKKVLCIVPASLRVNWAREAEKWLIRPMAIYIVDNNKPIPPEADFVIVNYDRLIKPEVFESLMARQWDLLLVDEAHKVKNPKAKRTTAILGKAARKKAGQEAVEGLVNRTRRRVFLTGTPILNRPVELHPLLAALDPKEWGDFFRFAKRYCNGHQTRFGWDFTGSSHLDELQTRLRSTLMVRRLKKDVLTELPAKTRQIVVLAQNGAAGAVKEEAETWARHEDRLEELRLEADLAHAAGDEGAYKKAVEALRMEGRIAFEEISEARHAVALAKLPAVIEHIQNQIEDDPDHKVIIFAHHKDVVAGLYESFKTEAVVLVGDTPQSERTAAVDAFQSNPATRVFIGSIMAAGVGLTLTASSHVIFAELDWVPGNITQAEDRAHRIGQTNQVLIQHLVIDGSLDARMVQMLVQKQAVADAALDNADPINDLPIPVAVNRPAKYPVATDAERGAAMGGILKLAGMCDGAHAKDEYGFNKLDAKAGHALAARFTQRSATDGEVFFARKLITKYHRQIPQMILDVLKIVVKNGGKKA